MSVREMKLPPWTSLFAALAVGLLFLVASLNKVMHPADFALSIFRYQILPPALVNLAALMVSWLELVCAVCVLFVPKMRRPALLVLLGLLIVFTGAILLNIFRGIHVACGCFSSSPFARPLGWLNVVRNSGLILLALLGLTPAQKRASGSTGDME